MDLKISSNNNQNYKNTLLPFKGGNNPEKPDEEAKNSSNNSFAFGLAAAAVSAAVVGGIAFASGKNKIPPEVLSTIKAADELQNNAQNKVGQVIELAMSLPKKVDEVCTLFRNGGKDCNGNIVGKIIPNTDNKILAENFLEEYSKNGALIRKSGFIDDFLVKIEEFTGDGKKNILEHNWMEGGIQSYTEGYSKLPDGGETFAKKIDFTTEARDRIDSPYSIYCLYTEKPDITGTQNVELEIAGGDIERYFEGCNRNTDANQLEIGRGLWLKYRKPDMYVENNTISKNNLENVSKELNFKDGKPVKCTFDSKEIEEGIVKAAKAWELQDDKWVEITS